jgi:hypothetical protein
VQRLSHSLPRLGRALPGSGRHYRRYQAPPVNREPFAGPPGEHTIHATARSTGKGCHGPLQHFAQNLFWWQAASISCAAHALPVAAADADASSSAAAGDVCRVLLLRLLRLLL